MDARTALTRLGGIARWSEISTLLTRPELESAITSGDVVRLQRGSYALSDADTARIAAARVRGVVSHLSAALTHGWKVARPPKQPCVTVSSHRARVRAEGIVLHWGDLTGQSGITTPVRTVIDCARTLPFAEALAVADSALRSRKVDLAVLLEAAAASPRTGRAKALRVVRAADSRAANPFESVLRAIAMDVPLLSVEPQGEIDEWTHPDLLDRRLRMAIEAESWTYHSLQEAFEYDVRRHSRLVRDGWVVVRFTWDDVMHKPDYVRETLQAIAARQRRLLELGLLAA